MRARKRKGIRRHYPKPRDKVWVEGRTVYLRDGTTSLQANGVIEYIDWGIGEATVKFPPFLDVPLSVETYELPDFRNTWTDANGGVWKLEG